MLVDVLLILKEYSSVADMIIALKAVFSRMLSMLPLQYMSEINSEAQSRGIVRTLIHVARQQYRWQGIQMCMREISSKCAQLI